MSNDVDPQSPGPQPNPFDDVRSDGSPMQPVGTSGVEPSGASAPPGPVSEYSSDASGPPLPPVIEAFPGYHGVRQPPKKAAKKVVGSQVIQWPDIVAVGAARIAAILAVPKKLTKKVVHSRVIRSPTGVGIGVAGIAVILVVAVITVLLTHRRGPNPGPAAAPPAAPSGALPPSPSPPPTFTRSDQLNGILLSVAEINVIMNASDMETSGTSKYLVNVPRTLSNPDCVGAFDPVQAAVYAGSGNTAVRFQEINAVHDPSQRVEQAAVMFSSADEASRFVQNSAGKWKNCANQTVKEKMDDLDFEWTFASLNGKPPAITLNRTLVGPLNLGCERALSAVSNVVVDVLACGYHIANEGGQIADKMVAKVKGQ